MTEPLSRSHVAADETYVCMCVCVPCTSCCCHPEVKGRVRYNRAVRLWDHSNRLVET